MVAAPANDLTTAAADVVLETIRSRRSIGKVGPERPSRETIERLLDAATWAPNHHLTEPWRFFVLTGEARDALGQAMGRALNGEPTTPEEQDTFDRTAAKALRSPVVIAIAVEIGPNAVEAEEVAAGAAAVQNLLLAAHALGLAAMWRTGAAAFHPEIKAHFGLAPTDHLLGFVYLGYPAGPAPVRERRPAAAVTEWRGWDD